MVPHELRWPKVIDTRVMKLEDRKDTKKQNDIIFKGVIHFHLSGNMATVMWQTDCPSLWFFGWIALQFLTGIGMGSKIAGT